MIVYQNQLWFLSTQWSAANQAESEPITCVLGVHDIREVIRFVWNRNDRIGAIKYVRTQTGCTLKYACEAVDYIRDNLNVEEITEYKVFHKK